MHKRLYSAIIGVVIFSLAFSIIPKSVSGNQYETQIEITAPTATSTPLSITFLELSIILILGLTLLLTAFVIIVRLQVKHKLIDYENKMASNHH